MRAKLTDKSVCKFCNGTSTGLIKIGGYTYAVPCVQKVHTEQPELIAEEEETEGQSQCEHAANVYFDYL